MSESSSRRASIVRGILGARRAEPAPPAPARAGAPRRFGSLSVRHVDTGSCNACEVEIANAFGPIYDAARYGTHLVASPRHADALLVTGVVTANMAEPLRRTHEAAPEPCSVIACGDCAIDGGLFRDAYAVLGPLESVLDVHTRVPGCPPHPRDIVAALRAHSGR